MEDIPGYDVQELLGSGRSGGVWRALHRATGESVVLRRLSAGTGCGELAREVEWQRSLATPYLLRLRDVVEAAGTVVLVVDFAAGGSLARLITRRGVLEPGEIVTIAAPLAQALAAVHAGGRVHGGLCLTNVLFAADGMPLLAGLGLPLPPEGSDFIDPRVLAGADLSAASDVCSLAAMCRRLGGPELSPPLDAVVAAGLAADPAARPDAAGFAAALLRAHPPAPVRLTGPTSGLAGGQPPIATRIATARRPSARRVAALGGAGALVLLLAGGVGWASGQRSADPLSPALPPVTVAVPARAPVSPTASSSAVSAPSDWRVILEGLDAARAGAFARADVTLLGAVWAPGTAGLVADTAAVRRLIAARQVASGVRHHVVTLHVVRRAPQRVALRVTDRLDARIVRDARGRSVDRVAARPATSYDVVLVLVRGQWRLGSVTPAGSGGVSAVDRE